MSISKFHIAWRLLPLVLCAVFTSCHNDANSNVPDYPVALDLDIYKMYPNFVIENGFQTMTFTQKRWESDYLGFAGILVWINVTNQYCAADLACPHCVKQDKPIQVDGLFATCPVCGEVFDLSTRGFPTKGIANQPLKNYELTFSNGILRIRN
ncbi:MAG: hypothetical protein MJZ75_01195 [Paludibacteraceae bacterium]|nr:hypothetical protein [Paludibacteraceae bacterium]